MCNRKFGEDFFTTIGTIGNIRFTHRILKSMSTVLHGSPIIHLLTVDPFRFFGRMVGPVGVIAYKP